MIEFSVEDNGVASFRLRRWPEYIAAWILGAPLSLGYFAGLVYFAASDIRSPFRNPTLFYLVTILAFPIILAVTNIVHLPILNLHWLFTEVRTLILRPEADPVLRWGCFPVSIQKAFPKDKIERLELRRYRYGKGLDFFYFWLTQAHLHSLCIVTSDNRQYYLAVNEVKDAWLADAGRKVSEFLNVPFEEHY